MNLNKIFLVGRVTAKPELKSTPGGSLVVAFGVATNNIWTDKNGKKQEEVTFHNVVFWGRTAETIAQYVDKGQEILVEGRVVTRSWEDRQGQKRQRTEVVGERFQFGQRPQGTAPREDKGTARVAPPVTEEEMPGIDGDDNFDMGGF